MAEHIPKHLHGQIAAIMFNLGYLPGADKQLITRTDSTLAALDIALALLTPTGCLTILAYPGHVGGDTETAAVENWCATLSPADFRSNLYFSHQPSETAPRLWVIDRLNY